MSIKKQLRKIGEPVTVNYDSSQKTFTVSTTSSSSENASLKKAIKSLVTKPTPAQKAEKPKTKRASSKKNQKES